MFATLLATVAAFAQPQLQPWAPLVGHCWSGPLPGNQGTDRHCFENVYGGQHIRDRHVVTVDGKDVYEGETIYSVKGPQVVFTYWNSLGGFGTGTAVFAAGKWHFKGSVHATPASAEQPIDTVWKIGPSGYEVSAGGESARTFKRAD